MGTDSDPRPKKISRRDFLKLVAGATASALLPACATPPPPIETSSSNSPQQPLSPDPQNTLIPSPTDTPAWQSEQLLPQDQFLSGQEANQIAKSLNLTPEAFFSIPEDEQFWQRISSLSPLSDESILSDFNNYSLPPVFPPSVIKWQDEIKSAVASVHQQTQIFVPPEIIAFIMTAESAGLSGVDSPEPHINDVGIGLMQVLRSNMEHYILEKKVLGDNMTTSNDVVYNPRINVLIGTHVIADAIKYVYATFFNQQSNKNLNDVSVLSRLIGYYNGGHNGANLSRAELLKYPGYVGTAIYRDDCQRFLITLTLSKQLKLAGYSDLEIVNQLKSTQVDAMAYAMNSLVVTNAKSNNPMAFYDQSLDRVSHPETDPNTQQLINDYLQTPHWSMPQNPALRIFCNGRGGIWLIQQSPENLEESNYGQTHSYIKQQLASIASITP